ncbi:MAG: hypothetical protein AUJ07_00195 [Crenarchaeota archaeon 13_1_40CM_3_53_5]|nr:MAG: hypothetical protein AUJ07_00195 [Crenarchaeota archaeon 13_1_40CM_3_53_5]
MANPDLILHNGVIYSQVRKGSAVQALAIWNGRITDVGTDHTILRLRARSVKELDLQGRTVIPGLIDSHIHLLGYGMTSKNLDLGDSKSIGAIKRAVKRRASRTDSKKWIVGRGWDQERLSEHRPPVRGDLDFTSSPVFLKRVCGHVAVANSAALALAMVDEKTPNPAGGVIEKDEANRLTGVLKEGALALVQQAVPRNETDIESALVSAARRLLRLGLTSLHCIIEDALELKVLKRLSAEGRVKQSIYAVLPIELLAKASSLGLATEKSGGSFRVGGVKVFLDGSLGARTAALREPYSDSPTSGMLTMERGEFDHAAGEAVAAGFQLSIHAIGDKAVEQALGVLAKSNRATASRRLRHRIEHVSLVPPSLLSKMRKYGVLASVQPPFIYTDYWAAERLGQTRLSSLYPFRSMLDLGVRVAAGSDCPAAPSDPLLGVWSAVARPGLPSPERLTVSEALSLYAEGSAFASFSENREGSLEPGKQANLVILDRDLFQCPTVNLRNVRAMRTMIDGEFVA